MKKTPSIINRSLNKNHLKKVLLVFPSAFSANRKDNLKTVVKEKLELIHVKVNNIISEESCIVFEVTDLVEASASVVQMFGIDKVAIAKHITNGFTDIVTTIVSTGKQIILVKIQHMYAFKWTQPMVVYLLVSKRKK